MTHHPCTIRLDLRLDGDSPTGSATRGEESPRAFAGWLGLVSAVDALARGDHGPAADAEAAAEERPFRDRR